MLNIVSAASLPGSRDVPNEDWLATGDRFAVVLDGVTAVPDDGCVHGPAWYADMLGTALVRELDTATWGLDLVLADAIRETAAAHKHTCDLGNPMTPGAQVAILRQIGETCDYLVLGDATLVWQRGHERVKVVCDDRVDRLANAPEPVVIGGVRRYPSAFVASVRNRPGGFFVAAADPAASGAAIIGTFAAEEGVRAGLFTDGRTRLVERYGWTWPRLLDAAESDGLQALGAAVHGADATASTDAHQRGKASDDATGVVVRFA